MSLRRLISVLSVVVFASGSAALAQTKTDKKAPAKAPAAAPAKTPAPATTPATPAAPTAGSGSGSGSGSGDGSAVAPIEDAPPSDMEGRDENPDAPKGDDTTAPVAPTAPVAKKTGYPIEETQRPITLPENMAEVSIAPHFQVSPYIGGDALHARYGITKQVQLGVTYVFAGIYDDLATTAKHYAFHVGKAAGLDVTVLLTNFLGVRVGVPVYFDPFATSIAFGAPLKFTFGDKLAIGGMDDIGNITISKFAPSLTSEKANSDSAYEYGLNTKSRGTLQFSGYVEYQQNPKMAFLGRIGIVTDLGSGGGGAAGTSSNSAAETFIRAGVQYSPKKWLDVGGTAGFNDLSKPGSFGLAGILAVRI